jgi:hypothetical protein
MTTVRRVSAFGVLWFLEGHIRGARSLASKHPAFGFVGACGFLRAFSAAAPPNAEADDEQYEHEATYEDVRPSTQDHLLIFFLLLFCGYGGVLHLICGEESPFWVT